MSKRIGECHNEKELCEVLEETRQRRLRLRLGHETMWWNNLALLAGDHFATWDPGTSTFVERPNEEQRPRIALNHALTVARTELAKLTKTRPIMEVLANSDEPVDLAAAKVGKSVLEAMEWKKRLYRKRKSALWWMVSCGIGGLYVGWDPQDVTDGNMKFMLDPNTNEPIFDPKRKQAIQDMLAAGELDELVEEEYPFGDVCYEVYSPFQMLPDETKLDFDEIQDLITTDTIDIDVAKGIWGARKTRDFTPEKVMLGTVERRMLSRAFMGIGKQDEVEGALKIHTWWLCPGYYAGNKFLENGIMFRWAQQQPLELANPFPYQDGRMPFAFYQHIPSAMSIWPESAIQHIREPNLEMDKTVSQLIENKDYMANPMWRVATQHNIKGKIKNRPGSILRYVHVRDIPPPEPLPGLPMPTQVQELVQALRGEILDISGQGETSRGRVPSGVRSGVAVAYLQEEDETRLGPTVENFENGVAFEGSLTLERVAQYYSHERTLRLYRRDGMFEVLRFKGADLKNNTDVVCIPYSALPKSKAARQQYILELAQLGIEKDPRRIKEILELGQGEPDDTDKAIAQANRENNLMMRGEQLGLMQEQPAVDAQGQPMLGPDGQPQMQPMALPVMQWHNHEAHLQRHFSVMMDQEFDMLAKKHPDIVQLFIAHTQQHQQFMQQAMMDQLKMQAMAAQMGTDQANDTPTGPPSQNGDGGGADALTDPAEEQAAATQDQSPE